MKTIEVEDWVYEEFDARRKSMGVYGTKPPGVPFGYDDASALRMMILAYDQVKEIRRIVVGA